MALEKRALVDVKIPIDDADGEVAERVGCDVDAAGNKTVALHRREGSIVPDDLGDRIRRRHVAPSSAIVRDCTAGHTVPGWSYSASQLPGATLLRTRSTSASERSRSSSSFPNCECAGVPSGAVVRVAPVLFVRDSIPE